MGSWEWKARFGAVQQGWKVGVVLHGCGWDRVGLGAGEEVWAVGQVWEVGGVGDLGAAHRCTP